MCGLIEASVLHRIVLHIERAYADGRRSCVAAAMARRAAASLGPSALLRRRASACIRLSVYVSGRTRPRELPRDPQRPSPSLPSSSSSSSSSSSPEIPRPLPLPSLPPLPLPLANRNMRRLERLGRRPGSAGSRTYAQNKAHHDMPGCQGQARALRVNASKDQRFESWFCPC